VRTPPKDGNGDAADASFDAELLDEPHVRLTDETVLVGDVVETEIHLAAPGGLKTVEPRLIERLEQIDAGVFLCKLTDGTELTGLVNEPLLTIRAGERSLRVPTHQIALLRGFRRPATGGSVSDDLRLTPVQPVQPEPDRSVPVRLGPVSPTRPTPPLAPPTPSVTPPPPATPAPTQPSPFKNPFQQNPFQSGNP
jgi:hypothetical protein